MPTNTPSPLPADDTPLVRLARRGDREAFARLYHRHASAVYTLALRLTGHAATAEDIAQDTFLRMLQFLNGLRDGEPLRPWLKRVAANAAIDHLRRDRHWVNDAGIEDWVPGDSEPSSGAEADALLRRLSPVARTVFWLHEMEGWSHPELATRFKRSESWSKSVLSRALARLRADLEPTTGDDDAPR